MKILCVFNIQKDDGDYIHYEHSERTDNFILAFVQAVWSLARDGLPVHRIRSITVTKHDQ